MGDDCPHSGMAQRQTAWPNNLCMRLRTIYRVIQNAEKAATSVAHAHVVVRTARRRERALALCLDDAMSCNT